MELSELIESIDILEFISQYTEFTEKNGEYWALSPLKDENTPSFSVRKESNTFYDFSSGIGGNVLTFVRYYFKYNYTQAIEKLKEYLGESGEVSKHVRLSAANVARRYAYRQKAPTEGKNPALPDGYMTRYEKRADKLAVWEAEGVSKNSLDKFQVHYDSFSNRLVYPIRNMSGKIINIGGRTLDADWKDKGLRKYTYFRGWQGGLDVLYGLYENLEHIKKSHEIILFEGCKSVLIADSWGVNNTAAILTSHLNPMQMKLLAKLGCNVVFALDKDVDVKEDHNIKRLKQFVKVEYILDKGNLLAAKDSPVDKGCETWEKLYESKVLWK